MTLKYHAKTKYTFCFANILRLWTSCLCPPPAPASVVHIGWLPHLIGRLWPLTSLKTQEVSTFPKGNRHKSLILSPVIFLIFALCGRGSLNGEWRVRKASGEWEKRKASEKREKRVRKEKSEWEKKKASEKREKACGKFKSAPAVVDMFVHL